jgi:hypothetical protein
MSKYNASTVGYVVTKKGTETYTEDSSSSQEGGAPFKFESIVNTNYRKPRGGTVQDNLTKSEIKKKLVGYKSLKTQEAKKYLLTLTPFKTWIKYYNQVTKQFRTGGLLMKVDPELKYIMLVNTNKSLTWSVQLNENIIFVPDPTIKEQEEQERLEKEKKKHKEEVTKSKLYNLYIQGKLKKVD